MIAVNAAFLALSTVTILLRVYCRAVVVKSFWLDDWFALVAWVSFLSINQMKAGVNSNPSSFLRYSSSYSGALPLLVLTMERDKRWVLRFWRPFQRRLR